MTTPSAHAPTVPAHTPSAPGPDPVSLRVFGVRVPLTARGVVLSALFVLAGTGGPLLLASSTGLATAEDVRALRDAGRAEYVPRLETLEGIVGSHSQMIAVLADSTRDMQENIWQARAETLAREVSTRVSDSDRRERVRDVVFTRAMANLRNGDPIYDGLSEYLR